MADTVTVTLIQDELVQALPPNYGRTDLYIENTDLTDDIFWQDPNGNNPFALSFDGANDLVDLDTILAGLSATTTTGSIHLRFKQDAAAAGDDTLFSLGDTNANEYLKIIVTGSQIVTAELRLAAGIQWTLDLDAAIVADRWYKIKLAHDGVEPKLFLDNTPVPQTFSASGDKTVWVGGIDAGVDNARIGSLDVNSAGDADFFLGDIDNLRIFDGLGASQADGRVEVVDYRIDEGLLQTASATIGDNSTNGFTGTISGATWVSRGVGNVLPGGQTLILSGKPETPLGAIWLRTASATTTASVLKENSRNDR